MQSWMRETRCKLKPGARSYMNVPLTRRKDSVLAVIVLVIVMRLLMDAGAFTNIHHFAGGPAGAAYPSYPGLATDGTNLFGFAARGGPANSGVVFRVSVDGSNLQILHAFSGGVSDGARPVGTPVLYGDTLYGMTSAGGVSNLGTIFKLTLGATNYSVIHHFRSGLADGSTPYGSLIHDGTHLFGMTYYGGQGSPGGGVIFRVGADGSAYTNLAILDVYTNGVFPYNSLTVVGTDLYGMVTQGGGGADGIIFRMDKNGHGFSNLHSFVNNSINGAFPHGALTYDGTKLYGMTKSGGPKRGVIFSINPNGTGYTNLHYFSGGVADGLAPEGNVLILGSKLFGLTVLGGAYNMGVAFKMDTDGRNFAILHHFGSGSGDGVSPNGSLLLHNSRLYGVTSYGGTNGMGVIFSSPLDPPPNRAPTNIVLTGATVSENLPSGTRVGWFATRDPDPGDTFTYALVGGDGGKDNASFTVSQTNLLTAAAFNYEVQSNYSIRVQSTDQGGLATQTVLTVTVVDVVEETPVILRPTELANGNIVIRWSSITNHLYTVYHSTNLLTGFSVLKSNIPATPVVNSYTDSVMALPHKYWKVTTGP